MELQPNCAICNAPADPECPCESDRLQIAVMQAQERALSARLAEVRDWVIGHARTQILNAFNQLSASRKAAHTHYLQSLPYYGLYMQYSGHPPPQIIHPHHLAMLQSQISEAHAELKRGIDSDWRQSVLKYPEVLDYYYSMVRIEIPGAREMRDLEANMGPNPWGAYAASPDGGPAATAAAPAPAPAPMGPGPRGMPKKKRRDTFSSMGRESAPPAAMAYAPPPPPPVPGPPPAERHPRKPKIMRQPTAPMPPMPGAFGGSSPMSSSPISQGSWDSRRDTPSPSHPRAGGDEVVLYETGYRRLRGVPRNSTVYRR